MKFNVLNYNLLYRWVEDKPVAEKPLDLWTSLAKIVNHWGGLPKSKRPSSKSYANVLSAVNNVLTPAKLHFFQFCCWYFSTIPFKISK